MMNLIANLNTPFISIDVSDFCWFEPTEMAQKLSRAAVSFVLVGPDCSVEAAYGERRPSDFASVGRIVFTPPDTDVFGRTHTAGRVRLVTCTFDREHSERLLGSLTNLTRAQLSACLNVRSTLLASILPQVMQEAMRPGVFSKLLVESLGQAMLVECSRIIAPKEMRCSDKGGRLTNHHFRIIDDYLETLAGEAPSVSALASACGFSTGHFSRLFRERMQQSVGQYLRSMQVTKAQACLIETDLPVKQIAFRLGFSAVSNFSTAFRAATGFTPANYRSTFRHTRRMPDVIDSRIQSE
jgi:AraC family transcriptional regulator